MKVLVACEESQIVCTAFRAKGHEAYSCDVQECSGGHPEWHIQDDVLKHLDDGWDLMIAHPPCTKLSSVGNAYLSEEKYGDKAIERKILREYAFNFFMEFTKTNIPQVCIENPTGYVNTHWRKPDQIIHPYFFGDPYKKRTCLWLIGLPKLRYTTNNLFCERMEEPKPIYISKKGKRVNWCEAQIKNKNKKDISKIRSKTFQGVADAMADQWG